MIGRVVSVKSKGSAVVLVERIAKHPLYKKTFIRSKKYLVDDPVAVKDGDIVDFEKCKPISKRKHWKITKVMGANLAEIVEAEQKKKAAEVIAQVMPEESSENSESQKVSGSEDQKSDLSDKSGKPSNSESSEKKKAKKKEKVK